MNERGYETEGRRLKHEVDYYAHLLSNPQAMEEFRARARESYLSKKRNGGRALEIGDGRDLQGVDIVRQNITFSRCSFEGNTYGERDESTNYGAIGVETGDNDCVVTDSTFSANMFGDADIVVSMIGCILALNCSLDTRAGKTHTCKFSRCTGNQLRNQCGSWRNYCCHELLLRGQRLCGRRSCDCATRGGYSCEQWELRNI